MSQGNPEEAGKIYEELCRMEQLTAAERGVALFGLGTCLFLHESYAAASLQLRESWELLIASLGMEDPLTTRTMVLLSRTLITLGDLESGMEIGRGALKNLVNSTGDAVKRLRLAFSFQPSLSVRAAGRSRGADTAGFTGMGKDLWACLASGGRLSGRTGKLAEWSEGEKRKARISTVGPQTSRAGSGRT